MCWTREIEAEGWGPGPNILSPDSLARLRAAFEEIPLLVEHRFYHGARTPDRLVFDDADDLEVYLRTRARIGDAIWIWRYDAFCRDDNALARGKIPDADGTVPARGAY